MGDVGIIVNPWAGKDVRRLHAPVGHTSDVSKIGIVRRAAVAALDAGADCVHIADDAGRIAARAAAGMRRADAARVRLVDGPRTGSALDTSRGASALAAIGCGAVVVLGGDGTCRAVTMGWPAAPMIAISTGTNNVFPSSIDATSAGAAAGFVAIDAVPLEHVGRRAKCLHVEVDDSAGLVDDIALVDVALIDATAVGARAVVNSVSVREVVAAIASPSSTGLSSIAGRVRPLSRHEPGAVAIRLGTGSRAVRVPIVPGTFDVVHLDAVELLCDGGAHRLVGPGVLAYDGERDRVLPAGLEAIVTLRNDGPIVIDVDRVLHCAAKQRLFDTAPDREDPNAS